ncbi:hypothetical protein ACJX0J_022214, partial [Zea mays]
MFTTGKKEIWSGGGNNLELDFRLIYIKYTKIYDCQISWYLKAIIIFWKKYAHLPFPFLFGPLGGSIRTLLPGKGKRKKQKAKNKDTLQVTAKPEI